MTSATVSPIEVMKTCRVIAVVGASKDPEKEAHKVPLYLKDHGYRIIPINPTADQIFGEKAFPSLSSMPEELANEVEVIEVFRPSEDLPGVARQVVELARKNRRSYVFWSQTGLENEEAKMILGVGSVHFVMDACMRVVHTMVAKDA